MFRRKKQHSQQASAVHDVASPSANLLEGEQLVYDPKKARRKKHKKLKIALSLFAVVLIIGGFFVAKAMFSLNRVIQRNTGESAIGLKQANLKVDQLKGEGDGRINLLLLGVGDPDHAGANLSDTIMVMSLDPRNNEVAMLGLPRDLYVKIPGFGYDKINAAHSYGDMEKKDGGPELAKKVVSEVLDIPIHYYAKVNFSGFKRAIDSVNGVTVDVQTALYDSDYPCDYNEGLSCGFRIQAGEQKMNGATALKYVRCRKGNCGNDFGRAQRQQEVLTALRDKALQLNTLTNPAAISSLIDTIGDNVRTDLALWEIKRLAEIAKNVDEKKVVNKVLDDSGPAPLVRTQSINGASVVVPTAGIGEYEDIQALAHSIFADSYIREEAAKVAIENASTTRGLADKLAALLKSYNYTVIEAVTAKTSQSQTKIIDYTRGKKPYTVKYLENRFGVSSQAADPGEGKGADVKVIVGTDYAVR